MRKNLLLLVTAIFLVMVLLSLIILMGQMNQGTQSPPETTQSTTWLPEVSDTTESTQQTVATQPPPSTAPTVIPNRFTAQDFAFQNGYMACLKAPYRLGIDVSKYQGAIDWSKVAAAGIEFVIIRIGGRGYGQTGTLYTDEMAQQNYLGAKAAGLKVGAYFFSQAISTEEAVIEAEYALELTKTWQLDMPIVFDWEYISETARTANTDAQTVTACAEAFCQRIEGAGKQAMVYVRPELNKLILEELTAYAQWVALYSDQMDYLYHFQMWQYTNTGNVPGIKGNVDINLYIP